MSKKIHGYDGPTGLYAVVNGQVVSLLADDKPLTALATTTMKMSGH